MTHLLCTLTKNQYFNIKDNNNKYLPINREYNSTQGNYNKLYDEHNQETKHIKKIEDSTIITNKIIEKNTFYYYSYYFYYFLFFDLIMFTS